MAASLGRPGFEDVLGLPRARRVVVVLVDGLGARLIKRFGAYAPTLKAATAAPGSRGLDSVFPTTTAAALTSMATGVPPAQHGIIGYDAFDPAGRRVVNQLGGWPGDLTPESWQPVPTVFERLQEDLPVVTVSRDKFRSSALTRAALRGGEFVAASTPEARVRNTVQTLRRHREALVYLYWDDLDKLGHSVGIDSPKWVQALEELDFSLRQLVSQVPDGTTVLLTADHGMVDVAASDRLDYSGDDPALLGGVAFTAGEPRGVQLHFAADAAESLREETRRAWQERFGNQAWIVTREQALDLGWFGPNLRAGVAERIGDLIVAAREPLALYDGRRVQPRAFEMVGQHGSLTPSERRVPLALLRTP